MATMAQTRPSPAPKGIKFSLPWPGLMKGLLSVAGAALVLGVIWQLASVFSGKDLPGPVPTLKACPSAAGVSMTSRLARTISSTKMKSRV